MLSSVLVYEVVIERAAERDLKSLPTKLFDRIVPRTKPLHYTSILMLHKDGFRRRGSMRRRPVAALCGSSWTN
jgi:hypothetical protein